MSTLRYHCLSHSSERPWGVVKKIILEIMYGFIHLGIKKVLAHIPIAITMYKIMQNQNVLGATSLVTHPFPLA